VIGGQVSSELIQKTRRCTSAPVQLGGEHLDFKGIERNYIIRFLIMYIVKVVKSRNGGACDMHTGEQKDTLSFGIKSSGKELPLGRPNGRIILKLVLGT
jgi:hypothetical protein